MLLEINQSGKQCFQKINSVSLPQIVGAVLISPVHGIDLRQQVICVVRDDEDNAVFLDIDFPDVWRSVVEHFRGRFGPDLLP